MKDASAVLPPGHLDWWLSAEFVEESAGNALEALGNSAGSNSCSRAGK